MFFYFDLDNSDLQIQVAGLELEKRSDELQTYIHTSIFPGSFYISSTVADSMWALF